MDHFFVPLFFNTHCWCVVDIWDTESVGGRIVQDLSGGPLNLSSPTPLETLTFVC